MDKVILVDEHDTVLGSMEKLEAHKKAKLHRAFSLFVFNKNKELLLQRRAKHKYHSGGLWTNTCCSHPQPHEKTSDAAHRRLQEEMGFDCTLSFKFKFLYKVTLDHGLSEHEIDHVFVGFYDGTIDPNSDEVDSYAHLSLEQIKQDIKLNPNKYTEWFKIIFTEYLEQLN